MHLNAFFAKGISEHTQPKNRASEKAWFDGCSNQTHLSEMNKGQKTGIKKQQKSGIKKRSKID